MVWSVVQLALSFIVLLLVVKVHVVLACTAVVLNNIPPARVMASDRCRAMIFRRRGALMWKVPIVMTPYFLTDVT
jgi:hypothetical protein